MRLLRLALVSLLLAPTAVAAVGDVVGDGRVLIPVHTTVIPVVVRNALPDEIGVGATARTADETREKAEDLPLPRRVEETAEYVPTATEITTRLGFENSTFRMRAGPAQFAGAHLGWKDPSRHVFAPAPATLTLVEPRVGARAPPAGPPTAWTLPVPFVAIPPVPLLAAPAVAPVAIQTVDTQEAPTADPAGDDNAPPSRSGANAVPAWTRGAAAAAATGAAALALALLYHRLRGAQVLAHDTRAQLLAMLRERPGLGASDCARELGCDPSTAAYHLRRMVKEGVAVVDGPGRSARYFVQGHAAPADRAKMIAERDAPEILDALRAEPGASKSRLAEVLSIARPTVSWHLARLHKAGLVRFERDGREVRVYPAGC